MIKTYWLKHKEDIVRYIVVQVWIMICVITTKICMNLPAPPKYIQPLTTQEYMKKHYPQEPSTYEERFSKNKLKDNQ